ncbi:hypothetical protein EDEG_00391 [Edhazardia aedis USNM 41457]|uniref:SKP1 component dimerisation domain-containing protein n=1 Tax=Edhazardia aedis (strain USNM 41457) TaxID=1003232 RepID=J9D270_EDHAE|nr:hypothetical protein EDEG_00391 [Edhazardia aedis USNM 41457]|eukprot:EJW01674.1 hypothetical protein EDEG_00391 [Edhazardia aedis USNM 41457]
MKNNEKGELASLTIKTIDNVYYTLNKKQIEFSAFLENISQLSKIVEPIELIICSKEMQKIIEFIYLDPIKLKEGYLSCELKFRECDLLFINKISPDDLIELCNAANYLEAYYLLELTSFAISRIFSDLPLSEMKKLFKYDDLTKNDKDHIFREYGWLPRPEEDC